MSHPYVGLPPHAYWRSGVAEPSALELDDIYTPRFPIDRDLPIAAAGSCFAQHIGRQFKDRGYRFLDAEPPPPFLDLATRQAFGYDLYSARYGNLYSVRQLLQLLQRAEGTFSPVETAWEKDGRYVDPFRPAIEPGGLDSPEQVAAARDAHLAAVRRLFGEAGLVVFTFGLTEAWIDRRDGSVYPTCPGTVAGEFDPELHEFHNFTFDEIRRDTEAVMAMLTAQNPGIRFLFTISPVPLTATASGQHVLPATVRSKSTLRAVVGELYETHDNVDYFPSYELVASHPMRAMFFEPNLRSVAPTGVRHVMEHFFSAHGSASSDVIRQQPSPPHEGTVPAPTEDDVVCEEELLEVFGP